MVGILVVTHGQFGAELARAVEMIAGAQEQLAGVTIDARDDMPAAVRAIEKVLNRVDRGAGVIIFTDLLGGTPSNVSLTFLNRPGVEVISGVNLPMLLKAVAVRPAKTLEEVADLALRSGRDGITAATHILRREEPPRGTDAG